MIVNQAKQVVRAYLRTISGKAKTLAMIDRYVDDPALKEHILAFEKSFPKYELLPMEMIAEENKVALQAMAVADHREAFMDIPATGRHVELPIMLFYEVQNGKICHHTMLFDKMDFMEQLGVMQPA